MVFSIQVLVYKKKKRERKEIHLIAFDIRAAKWCWLAHNALF